MDPIDGARHLAGLRRRACGLWLAALALLAPAAAAAATTEIRVAHALSPDSHVGRTLAKMAEQLSRDSGGRIVLVPMGGGAAGNDQKAMQDAIDGKLEVFISSTSVIASEHPPLRVWDTPFLFESSEEAHEVLDSTVGQKILEVAS